MSDDGRIFSREAGDDDGWMTASPPLSEIDFVTKNLAQLIQTWMDEDRRN